MLHSRRIGVPTNRSTSPENDMDDAPNEAPCLSRRVLHHSKGSQYSSALLKTSSRRTLGPCMATASCLLSICRSRREDDPSVGVHISGQRDYSALARGKVRRSFRLWHAAPFNPNRTKYQNTLVFKFNSTQTSIHDCGLMLFHRQKSTVKQ